MKFDPQLPKSFVKNFLEANPSYTPGSNPELDALFNPSIEAKPQHAPMALRIKEVMNKEYKYKWAFDRCGQNPNHERVERLRYDGWDFATTKDVQMAVESTVKAETEIRDGDLRLMKIPMRRYLEIEKSRMLQAINMTNPAGKMMGEDGTIMGVNSMIPGVRTQVVDEARTNEITAKAVFSDAKKDMADVMAGGRPSGNASRVPNSGKGA